MVSGDLLLEARRRAGISQAELARRVGIPRSAIGRWERGEVLPSLERLRELIRACGLELTFGLANADLEDHDLTLIRQSLAVRVEERADRAIRATRRIYG
jgi:transcriptional regulator with XRE-family HTH domain